MATFRSVQPTLSYYTPSHCFVLIVQAYQNGELKGSGIATNGDGSTSGIPYVARQAAFIGRSNWLVSCCCAIAWMLDVISFGRNHNQFSDSLMDNVRMWTKVLPAAQIQAAFAQASVVYVYGRMSLLT